LTSGLKEYLLNRIYHANFSPMLHKQSLYKGITMVQNYQEEIPRYDPDNLLDVLRANLNLKNDAALARALEVSSPIISKIRHRHLAVGGALLIRIHEVTGLDISDLRFLMGDRRQKYRVSDMQGKAMADRVSGVVWPAVAG
jgi:hypothetical protein